MPDLTAGGPLWVYFILVAGIVALPGMDMAFVLASALVGGRRAGATAVAGLVLGGAIHALMGVAGVGLLLQASPRLFNALLMAGAVYVGWIGASLWRGASALGELPALPPQRLMSTFGRAVATCLLNPKAYLFMVAVFPQFLQPQQGAIETRAMALGLITAATQATVYGAVALGAARVRTALRDNGAAQVRLGRAVGALLLVVAAWTLWQSWQR